MSQYWNDEADDAVHIDYRYSFDAVSDPTALRSIDSDDDDDDDDDDASFDEARRSFEDALGRALPFYDSNG